MLLSLLALLVLQAPQAPPAPATGLLAGQVVDADSVRAVPGALLRLGPPIASRPGEYRLNATTFGMRWVQADGQGRFVIGAVPDGSYLLAVVTPGYLLSGYDQQQPNGPLRPIVVDAANRRHSGLVVKAWQYGAIEGTVLDEAGEPAVGIDVRALRYEFRTGWTSMISAGTTQTDDRGVYRIAELEPGDYAIVVPSITVTLPGSAVAEYHATVAAGQRPPRENTSLGLANPVIPAGPDLVVSQRPRRAVAPSGAYRTVFHPAAASPADAGRITLASGDERSGIDVRLQPVRTFVLSGVVDGRDRISGHVTVSLLPAFATVPGAPFALETASTIATADGRFTLLGVPEGEYEIRILRVPPPIQPMTPTTFQRGGDAVTIFSVSPGERRASPDPTWWARVPVTVGDADVSGVTVPLRQGVRVSGRIEFRGSTPPPKPQPNESYFDVELVGAEGRLLPAVTAARVDAALQFTTMQHVPGRYFVDVNPAPAPWKLRSVTVNGRDALTTPIDLADRDIRDVIVTFVDRETAIDGTVRASGTAAVGGANVVLLPADVRAWLANGMNRRVFRAVAAGDDGAFSLPDLLPGDYLLAAVPADAAVNLHDPQAIQQLARMATAVTVSEGDRRSVSLTVVTVR
jgi:hypothetical protein